MYIDKVSMCLDRMNSVLKIPTGVLKFGMCLDIESMCLDMVTSVLKVRGRCLESVIKCLERGGCGS